MMLRALLLLLLGAAPAAQLTGFEPTAEHRRLAAFEGSWTFAARAWRTPAAPPIESSGTAVCELFGGGLWLVTTQRGQLGERAVETREVLGYDTVAGRYVELLVTSATTAHALGEGSATDDALTLRRTIARGRGEPVTVRVVRAIDGPDRRIDRVYVPGADGEEALAEEVVYTRVAADALVHPPAPPVRERGPDDPRLLLDRWPGEWSVLSTVGIPGAGSMASRGRQTDALVCGGLWVMSRMSIDEGSYSYEGLGFTGWDPARGEYVVYWVDDTGPQLDSARGPFDGEAGELRLSGESPEPGGAVLTTVETIRFDGRDARVWSMRLVRSGAPVSTVRVEYERLEGDRDPRGDG